MRERGSPRKWSSDPEGESNEGFDSKLRGKDAGKIMKFHSANGKGSIHQGDGRFSQTSDTDQKGLAARCPTPRKGGKKKKESRPLTIRGTESYSSGQTRMSSFTREHQAKKSETIAKKTRSPSLKKIRLSREGQPNQGTRFIAR